MYEIALLFLLKRHERHLPVRNNQKRRWTSSLCDCTPNPYRQQHGHGHHLLRPSGRACRRGGGTSPAHSSNLVGGTNSKSSKRYLFLTLGFVIGSDINTQEQRVAGGNDLPQASHGDATHQRSIRSQLIQDNNLFEVLVEKMTQSGSVKTLLDLEWGFSIDLASILIGRGDPQIPEWVSARDFRDTWRTHTIGAHTVNCAAFALVYAMHDPTNRSRDTEIIKRNAFRMTQQYGWENGASARDIMNYFTSDYPEYRVTILMRGHDIFSEYTSIGDQFEYVQGANRAPSRECLQKIIYLLLQPPIGRYKQHYALVRFPLRALEKNNQNFEWCHQCVRTFTRVMGAPACHHCGGDAVLVNRAESRKKNRLAAKPKKCDFCQMAPCATIGQCPKKCQTCKINLKAGYDIKNGEGHRCIVRLMPDGKELWTPETITTKDAESKTQIWVYDFESCITRVPGIIDEMFVTENHGFTFKDGQVITTRIERAMHSVNMAVCVNMFDPTSIRIFKNDVNGQAIDQFIQFVLTNNYGDNILIAHNGAGYDTRLVYEYVCKTIDHRKISAIVTGCKFLELKVRKTIFHDSLLHLSGSLANLAKAFNLRMRKGYFPHLFNTVENQNYVGRIPDEGYFDLTFSAKTSEDVIKFKEWHASQQHRTDWSFKEEIEAYCIDDVKILAEICLKYHLENVEKRGICPWLSTTAPGYCHKAIKTILSTDEYLALADDTPENDLERRDRLEALGRREHWAVLTEIEYWFARRALRGGRTDVRKLTHTLSQEEIDRGVRIAYVDVVSMYPAVQVLYDYPVGVPEIFIYDAAHYPCTVHRNPSAKNIFAGPCPCGIATRLQSSCKQSFINNRIGHSFPSAAEILADDDFFGIVCVSLTPPTNLFIPALVTYDHERGKCMADLEPMVNQVFTSVELKSALRDGYRLDCIHRFDKYHRAPGLWNDFIKTLYIDKMANSLKMRDGVVQYPSEETKQRLVESYEEKFQMGQMVEDSFPTWDANPVKKQVAKIMLNSGWGKHCQRPNLTQMSNIGANDMEAQTAFINNIDAGYVNIKSVLHLPHMTSYEHDGTGKANPNTHGGYLPAGLFVPAYGRLMLYEQMRRLGKRVLYHDTDSIIYLYDPAEAYNIPTSDIWGGWEEEDCSKVGIVSFTAIAPKSYGYRLSNGKEAVKFKGVSLKDAHKDLLNLSVMEEMVEAHYRGEEYSASIPQFSLRYSKRNQSTFTNNSLKKVQFQSQLLKGTLHTDKFVYPQGYCRGCLYAGENHTCINFI